MLNPDEYFEPLGELEKGEEAVAVESKSFWKDVWDRFCGNKKLWQGWFCWELLCSLPS